MPKPSWYSSYESNNYGDFFYFLIRIHRPRIVVELGTKAGYSAYYIAQGLLENDKGQLHCYDLWEDYPFNSVPESKAEKNLKEFSGVVQLHHQNAIGVEKNYQQIDILHVDLSNDGAILEAIIPRWIDRVRDFIIIEGGSVERDNVDWMLRYKKNSIIKWLQDFGQRTDIEYYTITPFPSVTIIRKKRL